MGDAYCNDLLTTYGFNEEDEEIEPEDPNANAEPKDPEPNKEKDPEKKRPIQKLKKKRYLLKKQNSQIYTTVMTRVTSWVYHLDQKESSQTLFFGAGMGGEDIEAIMKGDMGCSPNT